MTARAGLRELCEDDTPNAPMLAINRKLGYVAGPLELSYVKALRPAVAQRR